MSPVAYQRLESAVIAIAVFALPAIAFGYAWWWPLALFLAFDVSALGYVSGPRVGAALYNAVHSYVGPVLSAAAFALTGADALMILAASWAFHVAADRALGYGLKHPDAFEHTHLGWIGKARAGE
ncbi:DUF4260 domain-containing protein [Demequina sp. SO4-18]|uniref:DUF4260 domain-containing protein n=1 Tax=Demequina sp. SO4-18 TaxID=3401026 RepID=UPI003B5C942B